MALNLYWKDNNQNSYMLGTLYKDNEKYCFDINEKELKKATHKGCFGIGELNLLYNHHISDKLFIFFKRSILFMLETGEEKVILFNLSGHGLIDMASYDQYFAGNLMNYELKDEDIQKNLDEIKDI